MTQPFIIPKTTPLNSQALAAYARNIIRSGSSLHAYGPGYWQSHGSFMAVAWQSHGSQLIGWVDMQPKKPLSGLKKNPSQGESRQSRILLISYPTVSNPPQHIKAHKEPRSLIVLSSTHRKPILFARRLASQL